MKSNFFEKHPKITLALITMVLSVGALFAVEKLSRYYFGLGNTVIYAAHPIYGYRPEPNQLVARNPRHTIKINNLGLRADKDWDINEYENKILFLGDSVTYGGSYVSNDELFSYLSVQPYPQFESGNAGVNGWGVDNVHALVKEMQFLPAQIYVSVFPEGDFYRGLMRIGGQPFWTKKPRFALEELFQYFIYKIHLLKMPSSHFYQLPEHEKQRIAELAVQRLKALDDYLRANNREHLIYISPSCSQVLDLEKENEHLRKLFEKYHLHVVYLKDKMKDVPITDKKSLFHDEIHLSPAGHKVWANLISPDLKKTIQFHEKESMTI